MLGIVYLQFLICSAFANDQATHRGLILTGEDPLPEDYVLIASIPFGGHYSGLLEIGSQLKAQGETVIVGFCYAIENHEAGLSLQERILDLGISIYLVSHADAPHPDEAIDHKRMFEKLHHLAEVVDMFQKISIHLFSSLLPKIKKNPPKLVLYEEMFVLGGYLAVLSECPGAILSPHNSGFFASFDEPLITPGGAMASPPTTFKQRFVNAMARIVLLPLIYSRLHPSRALCDSLGFPSTSCHDWITLVDLHGHLVLLTSIWPLVIPYHHSPVVQYVGPQISPSNLRYPEVDTLLEEISSRNNSVLYVGFGSEMELEESQFLNLVATLESLTSKLNLEVLWARGTTMAFKYNLNKTNEKIHLKKFLPQKEILRSSHIVGFVSHCGSNGIMEAVYYGVPVICIPLGRDQPMNANRLVTAGASITLNKNQLEPNFVTELLINFLFNETVKQKAKTLKEISKSYGGLNRSIELIHSLMLTKGYAHMSSFQSSLPWIQRQSIDTTTTILGTILLLIGFGYGIIKRFIQCMTSSRSSPIEKTKQD